MYGKAQEFVLELTVRSDREANKVIRRLLQSSLSLQQLQRGLGGQIRSSVDLYSSRINKLNIRMVSRIRQNFHEDCEASINMQINMEFYASFVYLSMVSFGMICHKMY